ncbi:MAG: kelch repeat-containing protein, partial [Actinomycetota bacterium]
MALPPSRSARGFLPTALLAIALVPGGLVASPAAAQSAGDPSVVGRFSAPFEEGGASPRCREVDGRQVCKPTAVSIAVLNDGRLLYFNGIEGTENAEHTAASDIGTVLRDAQARTLDLRGSTPGFAVPTPVNGGGTNPNIGATDDPLALLLGAFGVPGRPGDGLVGSTIGQFYPSSPWASPDDAAANDVDMFCSDLIHLADGRLLIAGGTDWYSEPAAPGDVPEVGGWGVPELEGIRNTRIFDPKTNRFAQAGHMKYGRWYPTLVTLPNGKILVVSGVFKLVKASQLSQVRRTETFDPRTRKWTENYTGMASENSLPLYPRLHLVNGKVFYSGAGQSNGLGPTGWAADEPLWAMQQMFDPGTSEWQPTGLAQLGYQNGAFSVMLPMRPPYDETRILMGGGTPGQTPGLYAALPFSQVLTIDGDDTVSAEMSGNLGTPRWFSTAVVLPDGKVAAFSGANADEVLFPGPQLPVRQAELYDPQTGEWTPLATAERDRTYHNTAILLPDARVLIGGHSPIPPAFGEPRLCNPVLMDDKGIDGSAAGVSIALVDGHTLDLSHSVFAERTPLRVYGHGTVILDNVRFGEATREGRAYSGGVMSHLATGL